MANNKPKTETKSENKPEVTAKVEKPVAAPVSHNPAFLVWPTDVWGLTKDIKKATVALSNRIKGQPDKKELVEKTLAIALAHIDARYEHEVALRKARLEKAAEESGEEPEAEEDTKEVLF